MLDFILNLPQLCGAPSVKERLSAISSIDGRYGKTTTILRSFFSEAGLQRLRTLIEIEWLIFFCKLNTISLSAAEEGSLREIITTFTLDDAVRIKEIEKTTNHDVKCVEYFINEKLDTLGIPSLKQYTHILLTSEDITNVAYALMVKVGRSILLDELFNVKMKLEKYAGEWKMMSMLGRTHGQGASPTTTGKEFIVFANRLRQIEETLKSLPITAKWNGATGNFNAHVAAYPNINWIDVSQSFIENRFCLTPEIYTGQTNHYLYLARILNEFTSLSAVSIDIARDMWSYISYASFGQKLKKGETGSSTMPHKVNPIDFENAEGNAGVTIAMSQHMAVKLQISRMQRDLSDSTVLRCLSSVFAHALISLKSMQRGLNKITLNMDQLKKDLENNPGVISEAIQQVLRINGIPEAYEMLKEITRGKELTLENLYDFVESLKDKISVESYEALMSLVPESYTGLAKELVEHYFQQTDNP